MKSTFKITIGFTAEIIFFVLAGMYLANGRWFQSFIALFFAIITAGAVGKLIEEDAIEKYKKEIEK